MVCMWLLGILFVLEWKCEGTMGLRGRRHLMPIFQLSPKGEQRNLASQSLGRGVGWEVFQKEVPCSETNLEETEGGRFGKNLRHFLGL